MMIFNVMGRHCVTHSAPGRHDSPKIQVGSHTHSLARIIRKWEKLTLGKWLLIAFYLQHFCLVSMYLLKWTVCQPVYFLENIRQVLENVSILRPEWSYYLPISLAIIISICCNFLILIAENCETFIAALRVAILTFKCSNMLRQNCIIAQLDVMMAPQYCQAQVLSPSFKSKIQVQSLKSKVQRKGTGTGAYTIILSYRPPPHHPTH